MGGGLLTFVFALKWLAIGRLVFWGKFREKEGHHHAVDEYYDKGKGVGWGIGARRRVR